MATALTQTTLSAAVTALGNTLSVVSATGIVAPGVFMQKLYVINPNHTMGELMTVVAVSGTQITVSRLDENRAALASGALVLIAPLDPTLGPAFVEYNPVGAPAANPAAYSPWVNIVTGEQWIYSSVTGSWLAGWNNPSAIKGPTAAVASAAGQVTPSGPLFHITGALAITGFVTPVGFAGGSFTVIPDGVFTWTAANNIALAGTAVVSKALTFTFDTNSGKWYPSYIA